MRFSGSAIVLASIFQLVSPQAIDPTSVPLSTRNAWCQNQRTTCPLLCAQETNSASTIANDCTATSLDWHCVCTGGVVPNATEYSLTIPFHICQEYGNQCVAGCEQNNDCSTRCRTQYTCGAKSPTRINATSTTSSSSTTTSSTRTPSGSSDSFDSFGGNAGSGSGSASGSALNWGQAFGISTMAAGVLAAFVVLL